MDCVRVERAGRVVRLTLNRPDRLNAVSAQLYERLLAELDEADADPEARAIVLAGEGRAFCAGADQKAHAEQVRSREQLAEYVELGWRVCERVQHCRLPVIAAVRGYALGAGAELATSADFIVMADDALMGFPEVSIGTYVGGGVTRRLPQLVGLRRATELLMLGEQFTGRQAAEWGLAYRAVPATMLDTAVADLAERLTGKAPLSVARLKAALRSEATFDEVLRTEAADLLSIMDTADWAEGVAAFHERRRPSFEGK
jgi:enoyl-CoA hydratase